MPQLIKAKTVRCVTLDAKEIIYSGVPLSTLLVPHSGQGAATASTENVGASEKCKLPTPVTPGEVLMAGEGGSVFFHPLPVPPVAPIERPCTAHAEEIMELRRNMARMELAIERLLLSGASESVDPCDTDSESSTIMTTSSDSTVDVSHTEEEVVLLAAAKEGKYWKYTDPKGKQHRCLKRECVLVDGKWMYQVCNCVYYNVDCRVTLMPLSVHVAHSIGHPNLRQMADQQVANCGDAHSVFCANHGA